MKTIAACPDNKTLEERGNVPTEQFHRPFQKLPYLAVLWIILAQLETVGQILTGRTLIKSTCTDSFAILPTMEVLWIVLSTARNSKFLVGQTAKGPL